jgi:hypothetical protein
LGEEISTKGGATVVSKGIMRELVGLGSRLRVGVPHAVEYGYKAKRDGLVAVLEAAMRGELPDELWRVQSKYSMGLRDGEINPELGTGESISVEYNGTFGVAPGHEFLIWRSEGRGRVGTPFPALAIPMEVCDTLMAFCWSHAAFAAINAELRARGGGYTLLGVDRSERPTYFASEAKQLVRSFKLLSEAVLARI